MRYSWATQIDGGMVQQDAIWQAVLGELEVTLSHGNFVTWFKNTQLLKQEGGHIVIGVINPFVRQTLENRYNDLIKTTLAKHGIAVEDIEYKMLPGGTLAKQP